jgi:hypothetical protein
MIKKLLKDNKHYIIGFNFGVIAGLLLAQVAYP